MTKSGGRKVEGSDGAESASADREFSLKIQSRHYAGAYGSIARSEQTVVSADFIVLMTDNLFVLTPKYNINACALSNGPATPGNLF